MTAEKAKTSNYKFKAEISQLLEILTHSLYTHRDIFIRELISNAADALDKVKLKMLLAEPVCDKNLDLEINITLDTDNKKFIISDTGIGMSAEELRNNIGTIAKSGTADFIKNLSESKDKDLSLIGKFGVGFYSVFMAGEKVEIITKSAVPEEPACLWESDGKGSFHIRQADTEVKRGTTITVFLRENAESFANDYTVKSAIEKYSNFVPFPIILNKDRVNTISAIWRDPKNSVKDEDYKSFFKFIAHQEEDPVTWLHFSADVPLQFNALLFVPKNNLEFLGLGKQEEGVQLFVKRVMVDPHAKEILPQYLRFIRGVVESDDLPINISRETLQENPYLIKIKNTLTGKFLSHLSDIAEKDAEQYNSLYKEFGRIIKEGYTDFQHKDQIAGLFRFNSSKCKGKDELVSLKEYVDRMAENQEKIYFLSGASRDAVEKNPTLEIFNDRDIEVLYCFDPIDEFALPGLMEFSGKQIQSVDQADPDEIKKAGSTENKEEEPDREVVKELETLTRRMKNILGSRVEDVRLSNRLVKSPAILVSQNKAMSSQMEKIMSMLNQEISAVPKVMEINKNHSIITNMLDIYKKDPKDPVLDDLTNSLFSTALLFDGAVDKPQNMAEEFQKIISRTAELYTEKSKGEKSTEKKK
ncbi:molecular chaperone HtpG [bacterium]|nr:molecular chaperone HtpG [bacterium]